MSISLEVLNNIVQPLMAVAAMFVAFLSVLGAIRSGAIKKFKFGALELSNQDAEREAIEISVRQALTNDKKDLPFEVEQLTNYYSQILAQSKVSFWFSLVFASIGFVAILLAAFLYTESKQGTTVAQFIAGTIMEAVASLFFVQSRNAQKSMGEFFDKLRKDRLHMESRKLCDDIESSAVKDALKLHLSLHYAGVEGAADIATRITGPTRSAAQPEAQADGPEKRGPAA